MGCRRRGESEIRVFPPDSGTRTEGRRIVATSQELDAQEGSGALRCLDSLLLDLSTRFVNVPAGELDAEIDDALRRICICLELDICALWEMKVDDPGVLQMAHVHRPLGGADIPERMDAFHFFPWSAGQALERKTVAIASLDDVPEAAKAVDLPTWRRFGVKSALSIPLSAGGKTPFGVISFCATAGERAWPDPLLERLGATAQIFANALARRRAEVFLRESEELVELATDAADMWLWALNAPKTLFWVNTKTRDIFGLPPGETIELDRFMALVHPDDRQLVLDTISQASSAQGMISCEYRFVRPDGDVRWMISRGRMYANAEQGSMKLMGTTADITARKLMEGELRANEFRLAAAIELAKLGLYESKGPIDRCTVLADARTRDILGIPPGLAGGEIRQYWLDHVLAEDRQALSGWIQEVMVSGASDHMSASYRIEHGARGVVWVRHLAHALARDEEGRAVDVLGVFQDVTEQMEGERKLKQALEEVRQLRDQLQKENVYLREQIRSASGHSTILGESEPIRRMLDMARKVAATTSVVLITGETGTGKELLAQAIHDMSSRKKRAMIKVNCAALPAPLIESELFGREKGAYTGAMTQQVGRFELADKSTIFLDEVGELPLEIQAKLLRVLQDGRFERLGGFRTIETDIRIIAATNRDLGAMVKAGTFREDLFHRLNVFPIEVPPLRSRIGDISLLVWKIVQEFNAKMGRSITSIPKATMAYLQQYPWPGNVRELRNVIERAMILTDGHALEIAIPEAAKATGEGIGTLKEAERIHVLAALEKARWRVSGKGGAAEALGLVPTTLRSLMKRLGIARPAGN